MGNPNSGRGGPRDLFNLFSYYFPAFPSFYFSSRSCTAAPISKPGVRLLFFSAPLIVSAHKALAVRTEARWRWRWRQRRRQRGSRLNDSQRLLLLLLQRHPFWSAAVWNVIWNLTRYSETIPSESATERHIFLYCSLVIIKAFRPTRVIVR